MNNDEDPLFEGINVTINVKINTPETYKCLLTAVPDSPLSDSQSLRTNVTFDTKGIFNITFFLQASYLVRNLQISRTLFLATSITNTATLWYDEIWNKINVIDLENFDYILPVLYRKIANVELVDNNIDGLYDTIEIYML